MLREEDRLARRDALSPTRPLRIALETRPAPRRQPGRRWLLVVVVVVLAAGGYLAVRTFGPTGIDATMAGQDAAGGPVAAPAPAGIRLSVPVAIAPSEPGFVSTLRGLVDGATALTANGEPVAIEAGGAFRYFITQGTTAVTLVATAADGTTHEASVAVTADPVAPAYPATAAVHVRASEWAMPEVRAQIVALARAGKINAVELDIKDEAGEVGYASAVPLATTTGAARGYYDAREAVAELHDLDVRVIGRIVCFLDPALAKWAWENGRPDLVEHDGRPDLVVLDGSGSAPLANNYGTAAFTNLGSAEVRQYQIDLAVEAAGLGFDEILYDYVRRPEGDLATMQFPGLDVPPEVAVTHFVADTDVALEPTGAALGISVFGISATRPEPTAQDIGLLAPNVDYVAPMVYPSHWGAGEYGVADPVRQPADIVAASLADFERLAAGSGAAVVPWLQDFSDAGVEYGAAEVRAQIDAAMATGAEGFLLWNPTSRYHGDALDPMPE